jgi:putative glutamine amidotransferase
LDASHYGELPHERTSASSPERDVAELELVAAALAHELPLLAICRGMEVLNVALGGTLCQHLPDRVGHDEHLVRPDAFTQHEVRMVGAGNGSELRQLVHSHHHQAVERLAEELVPWAWAPDGTIEAVRHVRAESVVGVQWHPEAGDDLTLFADLVEAARSSAAARAEAGARR